MLSLAGPGMMAWNYREVEGLYRAGIEVPLYILKWSTGPYMPKPGWRCIHPRAAAIAAAQIRLLVTRPAKYLNLLRLAIHERAVAEFLIAGQFALDMQALGIGHIHCHFGDRKLFVGYFCSQFLDLPLTVTVHAYEILVNPNPRMFKLAATACRKIVTVSEFNKRELVSLYGLDPAKIDVIHIHGDVSDDRLRKSVKLLIVAQYTEKKGHDVLFKAMCKLNRDDLTLWVVGARTEELRTLAASMGIADQVVFLGIMGEDLLKIVYAACDIFVLPSRTAADGDREGIPVAIMEAMSWRKPVITTRHVGIPELVSEILVDENDVDGLAEAIAHLADSPSLRAEMGERNYRIVKNEYSEAAVLALRDVFLSCQVGIDKEG